LETAVVIQHQHQILFQHRHQQDQYKYKIQTLILQTHMVRIIVKQLRYQHRLFNHKTMMLTLMVDMEEVLEK
jgi:hypothetical protein